METRPLPVSTTSDGAVPPDAVPVGDRPEPDFVQSFAKGLAVIESFGPDSAAQTLSDVARRTGTSRAAARRLLHTLVAMGFAETDGRLFRLRPRVLNLGFAYLHAQGIWTVAQPFMVELVEKIHESCSAAVLDGDEIVYVARVPTRQRIMSVSLGIGSRLPAHVTSMGRVLLAGLPDADLEASIARAQPLPRRTPSTLVDAEALRREILAVRGRGWCAVDQEMEPGLRSIAVPVKDAAGRTVAALNVGTHAGRASVEALVERILPALKDTASAISRAIGAR